jgi:hypothetical protein
MHAHNIQTEVFSQQPIEGTFTVPIPKLTDANFQHFVRFVRLNEQTGCHDWIGGHSKNGYGLVVLGGKSKLAHRVAYQLAHGDIPAGACVLHRCDRRTCVNVAHTFLGSKRDNTRDMVSKGRSKWKGNSGSRLTDAEKDLVWSMCLDGVTYYRIGKHLGRPQQTIKRVYLQLLKTRSN